MYGVYIWLVTAVRLYICTSLAYEMLLGSWKSLGNFCHQESGNPVLRQEIGVEKRLQKTDFVSSVTCSVILVL